VSQRVQVRRGSQTRARKPSRDGGLLREGLASRRARVIEWAAGIESGAGVRARSRQQSRVAEEAVLIGVQQGGRERVEVVFEAVREA